MSLCLYILCSEINLSGIILLTSFVFLFKMLFLVGSIHLTCFSKRMTSWFPKPICFRVTISSLSKCISHSTSQTKYLDSFQFIVSPSPVSFSPLPYSPPASYMVTLTLHCVCFHLVLSISLLYFSIYNIQVKLSSICL